MQTNNEFFITYFCQYGIQSKGAFKMALAQAAAILFAGSNHFGANGNYSLGRYFSL